MRSYSIPEPWRREYQISIDLAGVCILHWANPAQYKSAYYTRDTDGPKWRHLRLYKDAKEWKRLFLHRLSQPAPLFSFFPLARSSLSVLFLSFQPFHYFIAFCIDSFAEFLYYRFGLHSLSILPYA